MVDPAAAASGSIAGMPAAPALAPPAPPLAGWLARLSSAGFLLGLGLGAFGQVVIYLHDGKIPPPLGLAAAFLTAFLYSGVAALAGLVVFPLARRRPAVARWLVIGLLAGMTFFHLLSLWVRVLVGVFPSMAPFEIFLASPAQFLRAGLKGQGRRLVVLLAATLAAAWWLGRLLRRPALAPAGWARPVGLALAMVAANLWVAFAPPLTLEIRTLQGASPELRWMTTWVERNSVLDDPTGLMPVPAGPPLTSREAWRQAAAGATGPRPNVILLILESLPADHVHYAGYPRPITPNLDRLAAAGWQLERTWSTATQSNYAQMAILSSLLPLRERQLETYFRLDYPRYLFHDLFAELGYTTATISSQNEDWQGMRQFQASPNLHYFFHSLDSPGPHLGRGAERKLPDVLTTNELLRWWDGHASERRAVYLNFQRTHFPYEPPPGFVGPYQPSEPNPSTFTYLDYPAADRPLVINRYDNALLSMDQQVGRILAHLEARGEAANTLWLIVGDHGEQFGETGAVTHANNLDEAAVRVPMLLYWPGSLAPRKVPAAVSTLDLLPTAVELLGLSPQPAFQGTSFADEARYAAQRPAHFLTLQTLRTQYGVVCWPWKLVVDWASGESQLRRLDDDPLGEQERFDPATHPAAHALLLLLRSQRQAQLDYYGAEDGRRQRELAPRLLRCPELPAQ